MKIIGGSFGTKGRATLKQGQLVLTGDSQGGYNPEDIQTVNATAHKDRKFSVLSLFLGLLLTWIAASFFGLIGFILGLLLAVAGSFHSTKWEQVDMQFTDGRSVTLNCNRNAVKSLFAFQNRKQQAA